MTVGVYALIIEVKEDTFLKIGKRKNYNFLAGKYVYIGSALGKFSNNIENRLKRHFSKNKKLFWHIDYFLANSKIKPIQAVYGLTTEKKECNLSSQLSKYMNTVIFKEFGNSDCRSNCKTHLYYFGNIKNLEKIVVDAFRNINLDPLFYKTH
ncbi:MAG: GIY-YIG nuclease family protein [Candidatus Helarchaeota archaeon]